MAHTASTSVELQEVWLGFLVQVRVQVRVQVPCCRQVRDQVRVQLQVTVRQVY